MQSCKPRASPRRRLLRRALVLQWCNTSRPAAECLRETPLHLKHSRPPPAQLSLCRFGGFQDSPPKRRPRKRLRHSKILPEPTQGPRAPHGRTHRRSQNPRAAISPVSRDRRAGNCIRELSGHPRSASIQNKETHNSSAPLSPDQLESAARLSQESSSPTPAAKYLRSKRRPCRLCSGLHHCHKRACGRVSAPKKQSPFHPLE